MSILAQTIPNNTATIYGPLAIVTDGNKQAGSLSFDDGKIKSDGSGNLTLGGIAAQGKAATQAVATGGTITLTSGAGMYPLTAAAAATGMIMTKGTLDGQQCTLVNEGATNTITFAAAGTSNVALGVGAALAAYVKMVLIWDNVTQLWY